MGHGSPIWGAMRSLRRDQSVTDVRVAKGTAKRILRFAAPYKRVLVFFLVLVVIDAVIVAVNPLILRDIINNGILKHDSALIVSLALLAAGLALADALESLGARVRLKWPNDLLIGTRKVSGILCESRRRAGAGDAVVIGIGVNVSQRADDFPDGLAATATSLALEGVTTTREAVAAAFLNALEPLWRSHSEEDGGDVVERWSRRADFWGQPVSVHTPSGELTGVARALDPDGGLVITLASGIETTVLAGDLELGAPGAKRR